MRGEKGKGKEGGGGRASRKGKVERKGHTGASFSPLLTLVG